MISVPAADSPRPSRRLALGGILAALSWLFVLTASVLPLGRLFSLFLASFCLALAADRLAVCGGALVFGAVLGLSLIQPGILRVLPFALYFGPFPLGVAFLTRRFGEDRLTFGLAQLWGTALLALAALTLWRLGLAKLPPFLTLTQAGLLLLLLAQPLIAIHHLLLRQGLSQLRKIKVLR